MAVADLAQQEPEPVDDLPDPADPLPGRAWWHRYMEPEERRRIMTDLAITRVEHWAYRFVIMLTLSVVVAVMGLSLNSAAVVIGAMLLAPLMQPVLAAGGCLSMALFTKSLVALLKVAAATVWCIAIAYALSWVLPDQELTSEVLTRTQPDIKDLVVALAAGAAGAYATVRADASPSLPGVAVAVALVPPLASVGIALEAGREQLALGALLLYIANLSAIVVVSIVVFVITGFVPPRRLSQHGFRLTLATVVGIAVVALVAVPLYRTTINTIANNNEQRAAEAIVAAWLGPRDPDFEQIVRINHGGQEVVVELRGSYNPPLEQNDLLEAMQREFPGYRAPVQLIKGVSVTTTTLSVPEPTEQLLAAIRVAVDGWLAEAGVDHRVENIALDDNQVRIDVASTDEPPPLEELTARLQVVDPALSPQLTWSELRTITPEEGPTDVELTEERMRAVVDRWAADRNLVVSSFGYDGERVEVDVQGAREPDIARLEVDLLAEAEVRVPVQVYFTQRYQVTTTTLASSVETR